MKKILAVLKLLAVFLLTGVCASAAPVDLPVVTATTVATKRKDAVEDGIRTTVRSTGAEVAWRYFHRPELPFEVQCFFVAKDESTKIQFCWDYQSNKSGEQVGKFRFDSKELTGTGKIIGLGNQFEFPGAKIDGWIIRFVRDGKVIRVTSNQSHLEQLAKSLDNQLDEIAKEGVR